MARMKLHASITAERVCEAIEASETTLDNPGICTLCGADAEGCEPDAEGYDCDACGEPGVYGVGVLLFMVPGVL